MQRNSRVKSGSEDNYAEGRELDGKERSPSLVGMEKNEANEERNSVSETLADKDSLVGRVGDGVSDLKIGKGDDHSRVRSSFGEIDKPTVGPRSHSSKKKGSSTFTPSSLSDGGSASETDSTSTSDSEIEREKEERRRRKAQILAEKAAAKALEAIKERENMVARLEGEKQSLEKILEERANQQAQEASELQNSMMETMEAVELEKQKHNSTRMEALGRMAKLEIANADLACSLAAAQWKVEVEMNQLAELRLQVEVKEATHEELRRKISVAHDTGNQLVASKGIEFEREILESEISFVIEKIGRLQEKAKTLESNIEMTRQELENPTEVEVELRRRLGQLTDHLIQKQAQVEALSSEKATYVLRIEAVSRLLDENKSTLNAVDVESGIWEFSNSKLRPLFEERIQSGRKHFGSLVQQLDSIFCAGAIFLRRNSTARLWSLVYLVCLHFWVVYILLSHSPVSEEARSGAVFSLESINNTGGG
ncbi:golgin candidate 2 [Rhododendron vialii]|uniref:golgin candidate 2 n=1 Tax=Rhododendron vialii TaxID=182163 RepID=UPI00265FEF35|nr:golgin candidate 2 [Rhododendron vialii]